MTWPVALDIDDSIAMLTPCDLTKDSPLRFLEVQRLRNPVGEWGIRVLYATPDRVTHYAWPRGFGLPPGSAPLGAGIGLNEPADFATADLQIGEAGVLIDVDFTDVQGRRLVYKVRQRRPWRGFDFMAPPAAGIEQPTSFFFPYLRQFGLVPQPMSFEASFEGEPLRLQPMPFLWNWRPALSQKAARGVTVVELLADGAAPLRAEDPGVRLAGPGRLASYRPPGGALDVILSFDPPLPGAEELRGHHRSEWELRVGLDRAASGSVELTPSGRHVRVEWQVTRGWSGVRQPGAAWLLTRFVRFLRTWPRAYSWSGALTLDPIARLDGHWRNARPRR